jgi:hypothetical protein
VTGFTGVDVTLGGTAGATTATVTENAPNDGTTYNVAVSGMTGNGTVIATIGSNKANDGAGNGNTASTSTDNTVTYNGIDNTPPTVTINQASGQGDPTATSPINFTVVFSEPVTGFTGADVTLGGTAGATTATVAQIAPNDGTTYNVAVSGMTGNGTVIATIGANKANDGAGNGNTASTSTDNTVTYNTGGPVTDPDVYVTTTVPGKVDGIQFQRNDILLHNAAGDWSLFFDGATAGLPAKAFLYAIHVNAVDDIYMSFSQNNLLIPGFGKVTGNDIVHYDGGLSWYFDGSDVGLTTVAEKVDALHILPGSAAPVPGCVDYLLISTRGRGRVGNPGQASFAFGGEDVLGFCATSVGLNTQGLWFMVLDGSAEGMPPASTISLAANADGSVLYLTTRGAFRVDGVVGTHSMVYKFDMATRQFSGPYFSARAEGLTKMVEGLHLSGMLP